MANARAKDHFAIGHGPFGLTFQLAAGERY